MRILWERQESSGIIWTPDGMELRRVLPVVDLPVDAANPDPTVMWQAISAVGMPAPLALHPVAALAAWGLRVRSYDVKPMSPPVHNGCMVVVVYKSVFLAFGQNKLIDRECGLVDEETDVDADGQAIRVLYFSIPGGGVSAGGGSVIPTPVPPFAKQGGTVPVRKPYVKIICTQCITVSTLNDFDEATYMYPFIGRTNAATYRGGAAGTWLCLSATAKTAEGLDYILRREVIYREIGWKQNVAYVMPGGYRPFDAYLDMSETGLDPNTPSTYAGKCTNGFTRVKVYGTADFSSANFF